MSSVSSHDEKEHGESTRSDNVTTQVRSEKRKKYIFHNFVDFHFIFGARASQRILLVRDENKKKNPLHNPRSRFASAFFLLLHKKATHTQIIIFLLSHRALRKKNWYTSRELGGVRWEGGKKMRKKRRIFLHFFIEIEDATQLVFWQGNARDDGGCSGPNCAGFHNKFQFIVWLSTKRMTNAVEKAFYLLPFVECAFVLCNLIVNYWKFCPQTNAISRNWLLTKNFIASC